MSQQSGVEKVPSGLGWPEAAEGAGARPGSLAALAEVGLGDVPPAGVFDARWEAEEG